MAGIDGAAAPRLVARALGRSGQVEALAGRPVTLVAAGKAAAPMAAAYLAERGADVRDGLVAAPSRPAGLDLGLLEWVRAGHPVPDGGSLAAGRQALALAERVTGDGLLVLLLSGGASAALAVPVPGVSLEDKVQATRSLLRAGVPIDRINCVRKHLSAIKGGWLAAAGGGAVVTLAISDVVGPVPDDPAVIGSGPTAADPTSYGDALAVVAEDGIRTTFPPAALRALEEGGRGQRAETPKPGDPRLGRARTTVIGNRRDALDAAAQRAASLGYDVATMPEPVVGEAREAAEACLARALAVCRRRPACILSAGETTVDVRGPGRGGRNQEFALAAVEPLATFSGSSALASVGTDGIDGPTDAAGAMVDTTTLARAAAKGLSAPAHYLELNDSYSFFEQLGDLVRLGPTATNVGDLQVLLIQ